MQDSTQGSTRAILALTFAYPVSKADYDDWTEDEDDHGRSEATGY